MFLDARVVDEDVDFSERLDALLDEPAIVGGVGEIASEDDRLAAHRLDLCFGFICPLVARAVVDQNVGAFLRETKCDGLADSLGAAGDECGFSCEFHDDGGLWWCEKSVAARSRQMD